MKRIYLMGIVFILVFSFSMLSYAADQEDSIGVSAGKAFKGLKQEAETTYADTAEKATKAGKEMEKAARENYQDWRGQADEALKKVHAKLSDLKQNLNQEIQKFMETIKS